VAHVASASNCYAGETITFFTRIQAREDLIGFDLEIYIPPGFQVKEAYCLSGQAVGLPNLLPNGRETYVVWKVPVPITAESEWEFCIETVVQPLDEDFVGVSRAAVAGRSREHNDQIEDEEAAAVTVLAHARYLRYLPALFAHDRLMNRFLMLFESFWEPINQQISNVDKYFDPAVTPTEFLPWLSSWIALSTAADKDDLQDVADDGQQRLAVLQPAAAAGDVADFYGNTVSGDTSGERARSAGVDLASSYVDENDTAVARMPYQPRQTYLPTPEGALAPVRRHHPVFAEDEETVLRQRLAREPLSLPSPAENMRQLLRLAQQLHKRRGTRAGLQQYLEIYTATEVHVIEHRAENFKLSEQGSLGSRIALGRNNHPHSFTVLLRFPVRAEKLAQLDKDIIEKRKAAIYRRVIPIIEEQKPAHTTYTLQIEILPV
jgi:phage tail-like protein